MHPPRRRQPRWLLPAPSRGFVMSLPSCSCSPVCVSPASCPCVFRGSAFSFQVACSRCGFVSQAFWPRGWRALKLVCPQCGFVAWLSAAGLVAGGRCPAGLLPFLPSGGSSSSARAAGGPAGGSSVPAAAGRSSPLPSPSSPGLFSSPLGPVPSGAVFCVSRAAASSPGSLARRLSAAEVRLQRAAFVAAGRRALASAGRVAEAAEARRALLCCPLPSSAF